MSPSFYYWVKERDNPIPSYKSVKAEGCPMPDTYINGRPVYVEGWEGKGVDSFFTKAYWADTDEELNEDELDQLTDDSWGQDYLIQQNLEKFSYYQK